MHDGMTRAREESHARVRASARNTDDGGIRVRRQDGGRRGTPTARHFARVLTRYGVVGWQAGARHCRGGTPAAAPSSRYLDLRTSGSPAVRDQQKEAPQSAIGRFGVADVAHRADRWGYVRHAPGRAKRHDRQARHDRRAAYLRAESARPAAGAARRAAAGVPDRRRADGGPRGRAAGGYRVLGNGGGGAARLTIGPTRALPNSPEASRYPGSSGNRRDRRHAGARRTWLDRDRRQPQSRVRYANPHMDPPHAVPPRSDARAGGAGACYPAVRVLDSPQLTVSAEAVATFISTARPGHRVRPRSVI